MLVGLIKEIKNQEHRVGLTPSGVRELIAHGHQVLVERGAGNGVGLADSAYIAAGGKIIEDAKTVFHKAELIVKVKEPQPNECALLRRGQILFAYLHLAPDPEQTRRLLASGVVAIAYETVTDALGGLPLLAPMSEVAGRMAIQAGAHALEKTQGGRGILLGGVSGVRPANVLILGGGVVGTNATRMAIGLGADVTLLDRDLSRLKFLDTQYGPRLKTLYSTFDTLEEQIFLADLVIGAVLVPGAITPKLVTRQMLQHMRPGSVIVDVAIDQGGCFETSKPTTHEKPTYVVDGVVHYCVTNMPGAVPLTATSALTNATLPYLLALADKGYRQALLDDPHLRNGLNIHLGEVTHPAVADVLGYTYRPAPEVLVM